MTNHGTIGGYRKHQRAGETPCADCRAGQAAYQRRHSKERLLGYPPRRIASDVVVRHIERLIERGWTQVSIANAAGVGLSTVDRMHKRPMILRTTAEKILAVRAPRRGVLSPRQSVNAIGARRRLQGLSALGWTQTVIAEEAGLARQSLYSILYSDRERVHVGTHDKVRDTAARLELLDPRKHGVTEWTYQRMRKEARNKRWAPLAAWDGSDIDDPKARPVGMLPRWRPDRRRAS